MIHRILFENLSTVAPRSATSISPFRRCDRNGLITSHHVPHSPASTLIGLPLVLLPLFSIGAPVLPWIIFPVIAAEHDSIPTDTATIEITMTVIGFLESLLALVLSLPHIGPGWHSRQS